MILGFLFLYYFAFLVQLFVETDAASCTIYNYSGKSQVTVSTYDQLSCAVQDQVPSIFINQSIVFSSQIFVPSKSNITLTGDNRGIVLTNSGNNRLFNVTKANVRINNLNLVGNSLSSISSGGLIYSLSSNLTIFNSTLKSSSAVCGSAISSISSALTLSRTILSNNTATGQDCGGTINTQGGILSIDSTTFLFNTGAAGGSIYSSGSSVSIKSSIFRSNTALMSSGGGLYLSTSNSLTISNTQFISNSATINGGSISLSGITTATVTNTNFTNDMTQSRGGSCYVENSVITFLNVDFNGATALGADGNGGAFAFISPGSAAFTNTQFLNNEGSNAGAIYCSGSTNNIADISIESSYFENNLAINSGGAIEVAQACRLNITSSTLKRNKVLDSDSPISIGGGISCQYGSLRVVNSEIQGSEAIQGSALYSFSCTVQVISSSISGSIAGDGSITCASDTDLFVQDSQFYNNTGTTTTSGIICSSGKSCSIISSSFHNNTAAQLGVVQIANSPTGVIENCDFSYNQATGLSGALYFNSVTQGQVVNSTFSFNKAGTYGGSVAVLQSTVNITSTMIINSQANSGGGLYLFQLGQVMLQNCSLNHNEAFDSGGAIYIGDQSIVTAMTVMMNNNMGPYGAGVYMSYESKSIFTDLTATGNFAGFAGGVFGLFDYSHLEVYDSTLNTNQASLGGVISLQYHSNANISRSHFKANQAYSYGGVGYVLVSSFASITDCTMDSNTATFGGGAVFVQTSQLIMATSSINNHEGNVGGGIYAIGSSLIFRHSLFYNNGGEYAIESNGNLETFPSFSYEGGAVYLSSQSTLTSQYCNYSSNHAQNGGVIAILQSTFQSEGDNYEKCVGVSGPCLLSVQNSSVTLTDSMISNNYQQTTSTEGLFFLDDGYLAASGIIVKANAVLTSGVFGLYSVNAKFTNASFTNNKAGLLGGAIYIACASPCDSSVSKTTVIQDSRFVGNVAVAGNGGAVYMLNYPGSVTIKSSQFSNNRGKNGGAVSIYGTTVNIQASNFTANVATEGGGGVFWIYSTTTPTTIDSASHFSNNVASYGSKAATDLVKLSSAYPSTVQPVSGKALNSTIYVYLLDYYDQVVTNSSLLSSASITVYCNVYQDSGVIKGSSTVPATSGVAAFSQLVITNVPGGNTTLVFSVPVSGVTVTYQTIHFRLCKSGETTTDVGNNLQTCDECGLGTYSFYPTDKVCNICPDNAYCPGGNVIDVNSGYWRVDQYSANVLQCPQPDPCQGGTNTSTQCTTGSYGPYCSICEDGYTASRSGTCYFCDNSADTGSEILSTVLFFVVAFLCFLIIKYRKKIQKYVTSSAQSLLKNRKFRTLRVKIKIIVAFMQIVYQLGPALDIVFPISYLEYLNYYSVFQLNLLIIPNVNCIVRANYYDGLLVSTISPFILFAVIALVIQFLVIRARRLNEKNPSYRPEQAMKDTITVAFLISYFVMVNVSTQVFRVFQCEHFDDGSSYLVADYSIDCNAPDRSFYLAYGAVMILVYPIGIPLVYAIVLFKYRKKINPDWRKVIDTTEKAFVSNRVIQQEKIKVRNTYPEIDNIRNLFDSYTPKRWYFELFDCARRLCLGAIPVLIFRGSSLQIIIVLLVSLFSVAAFMYFNPYIHEHDNHLAILSQWSITLIVIAALVIKVDALSNDSDHDEGLAAILVFLNIMIIMFAILTAFMNSKETKEEDNTIFGIQVFDDEDDEEGEGEGDAEKGKKKKKKKKSKAESSESKREVDSDVGSDGEPDEDDRSLDSDDDNYQERIQKTKRNPSRTDNHSVENHNNNNSSSDSQNNGSKHRSVLAKVLSIRGKTTNNNNNSPHNSGSRTHSSAGEFELGEIHTMHNPMRMNHNPDLIEENAPHYNQGDPYHAHSNLPSPAPNRQYTRNHDTAIDSDDDEED